MKFLNHLIKTGLVTMMALLPALPALAQDWPTKGITLISPYAAGGFSDTRMRLNASYLKSLVNLSSLKTKAVRVA